MDPLDNEGNVNSVRIEIAYVLLLFCGTFGVHHAYLGRHAHGLVYFCTCGFFGWGLLMDVFFLPDYVSLARSDPSDVTFQRLKNIMEMHIGIPPVSVLRILGMISFGSIFSFLCFCLIPPNIEYPTSIMYTLAKITKAVGSSVGIYLVANVGSVTMNRPYTHLFLACLVGCLIGYHVTYGAGYANYYRIYRPSMIPKSRLPRRLGKHLLLCTGCICLFFAAIFIQLGISYEVIQNVRNSEFFKEFDFQEFKSGSFEYKFNEGGAGRTGYLMNALDLEGKRAARKTLGVSRTASMQEIKSAYKKLALQYHPDKIKEGSSAAAQNEKFMKIQEAYELLKKIEKRREDATKQRSQRQAQQQRKKR